MRVVRTNQIKSHHLFLEVPSQADLANALGEFFFFVPATLAAEKKTQQLSNLPGPRSYGCSKYHGEAGGVTSDWPRKTQGWKKWEEPNRH